MDAGTVRVSRGRATSGRSSATSSVRSAVSTSSHDNPMARAGMWVPSWFIGRITVAVT